MESIFINAGLAAGVALAAVPIILHLFMKQTPKHVVFPALRLIKERNKRSRQKIRIKNWLLLLARMAMIALMALALARPRLWSKTSLGDGEVPTALALIFDTSLSMGYKEEDKSRLDVARERAREILKTAHDSSRVFVIDSADPTPTELSPSAALKRIDGLSLHAINRPLNSTIAQAHKTVAAVDLPRREVYVLTDLARSSWEIDRPVPGDGAVAVGKSEAAPGDVSTYVVRLSPQTIRDAAVVEAEPTALFISQGQKIPIQVKVRSTGPAPMNRVVELLVDGERRGQVPITLPPDGEAEVPFETPELDAGRHRVRVHLGGEPDPLDFDDDRYVTLDVRRSLRVLLVSDRPVDADYVDYALVPEVPDRDPLRSEGASPFVTERVTSADFDRGNPNRPLGEYASVFLLNVSGLSEASWGRVGQYVRGGGGLVVALGDRSRPERMGSDLLPATLARPHPRKDDAPSTFGKADVAHPLFDFNTRDLLADLGGVPVFQFWGVTPAKDGTRTLLSYDSGEPALLERVFPGARAGRVLLWTTPLSRRAGETEAERRQWWNDFPITWSFVYLVRETVPYLAGIAEQELTYEAGEDVVLPIDPSRRFTSFTVRGPGLDPARLGEPVSGSALVIPSPPLIGQWEVTASGPGGSPAEMGFSINPPRGETEITPLRLEDLDRLLGKGRYALVEKPEDLKRAVSEGRIGRELFPLIMLLILLVVTAENVLANTFYRDQKSAPAVAPTRSASAA